LFRSAIAARLQPDFEVLDLGAGAGIVQQLQFKGQVRCVCGIDPDPRVLVNPHLDEAAVGVGEALPFADDRFDLVYCDNVVEHLPDPGAVFSEVSRVLKPGGHFLLKTPNRRHYVALAAMATPHWFHQKYNARRGRDETDTFPTTYLANTPQALAHFAEAAGMRVYDVDLIEGRPEYLRLTAPTYVAGFLYERLVNASERLASVRVVMIADLVKAA
jgi:SAM-dependent methyltransferase